MFHLLLCLRYFVLIFVCSSRAHLLVWARPVESWCNPLWTLHGPHHVLRPHKQPDAENVHGPQGPIPSSSNPQRHFPWTTLRLSVQLSLHGDRQSHSKGSLRKTLRSRRHRVHVFVLSRIHWYLPFIVHIAGKGNIADEHPTYTRSTVRAARGCWRWRTTGWRGGRGLAGSKGTAVLGTVGPHARTRSIKAHQPARRFAPSVHPRTLHLIVHWWWSSVRIDADW